jgi:hypothetical protein
VLPRPRGFWYLGIFWTKKAELERSIRSREIRNRDKKPGKDIKIKGWSNKKGD